jgi:hypothetical protein
MRPGWRQEDRPAAVAPARRWSWKLRFAAAALGFLLFSGLLVWVIYWLWPPKPACLVLLGAGYEENLHVPPNVEGRVSLQGLEELTKGGGKANFFWGSGLLRLKHEPRLVRTDEPWDKGLDSFKEKTVVVFLALHGGADQDGAYFLPDDAAAPWDEHDRLRLRAVLDRLAALPADKNKVLVLDATRVPAHWPLGLLHNDFARALEAENARITAIPNLIVLSASDADQRSWVSEEWRKSAYAHFLTEGLRGAADANGDGRVNALELHEYAHEQTRRWARDNRDALQTPVLLPHGDEGRQRAARMELVTFEGPYQKPALPSPRPLPLDDLRKRWQTYHQLTRQVPAPAVTTPHLWREYQATLLRYEQLVRAGDTDAAARLGRRLGDLERDMEQKRRLDLQSLQNTLAAPAAVGLSAEAAADAYRPLVRQFSGLWDLPADAFEKEKLAFQQEWNRLQEKAGGDERTRIRLLRVYLCRLALEQATADPAKHLGRAAEMVQLLHDRDPRPQEAHFLVMLARDLPRDPQTGQLAPPTDLTRLALTVRRLAEQTALAVDADDLRSYPYSEQVLPWIRSTVDSADQERRFGQDLLFAATERHWTQAMKLLTRAREQNEQTQRDARTVRAALDARDQALAALPYYSRWLAGRRLTEENRKQVEELVSQAEQLWQDLHVLDELLQTPDPKRLGELPPLTKAVRNRFEALTARFADECRTLAERTNLQSILPSLWHETAEVLAVPDLDPELRLRLLAANRHIAAELLAESDRKFSDAPGVSREENERWARLAAQHQGRLALAELGQGWFDRFQVSGLERYQATRDLLFSARAGWSEAVLRAGTQVEYRWQQRLIEIDRLAGELPKLDWDKARDALAAIDRLARRLDGAASAVLARRPVPKPAPEPVEEYRQLLAHALFCWQAERVWADHWFDESGERYYRVVGHAYLNDARTLDARQRRAAVVAQLRDRLEQPGGLLVFASRASPVHLTSEKDFAVEYRLQPAADGGVPPGYPVVWVRRQEGQPRQLLEIRTPVEAERLVPKLDPAAPDARVPCELTSPLLDDPSVTPARPPEARLLLEGRFRGQVLAGETVFKLHLAPDIIVYHTPPPSTGGIALRADPELHEQYAEGNGRLAIVLDYSGSMTEAAGDGDRTRIEAVHQALEHVLRGLPEGVVVSVWIFGGVTNQDADLIECVRPPSRWRPQHRTELMDLLTWKDAKRSIKRTPVGGTPVVNAMSAAKKDLPPDFRGLKTMLVLTDGGDSSGLTEAEIAARLEREFKDSDILINVIGFQLELIQRPAEQKTAAVFKDVIENRSQRWTVPAKFYNVKDWRDLVATLEKGLRPKLRCWLEKPSGELVQGPDGKPKEVEVTPTGQNLDWNNHGFPGLDPMLYTAIVHRRDIRQSIVVNPGDYLLAMFTPQGFRRAVFAREVAASRNANKNLWLEKRGDWLLGVLQNHLTPTQALEMMVTLENEYQLRPEGGTLKQYRPTFTWFEIAATQTDRPVTLRWGNLEGYPAPAWNLGVASWPFQNGRPVPPRLQAWWAADQEVPAFASASHRPNVPIPQTFREPLTSGEVAIERVEPRKMTVQVGGRREERECLVVQLRYPANQRVLVRLKQLRNPATGAVQPILGHEHRFYTEAGKYTGVFWPVTEAQAKGWEYTLELVSIEEFKEKAQAGNSHVTLDKLTEPLHNNKRPDPAPGSGQ